MNIESTLSLVLQPRDVYKRQLHDHEIDLYNVSLSKEDKTPVIEVNKDLKTVKNGRVPEPN